MSPKLEIRIHGDSSLHALIYLPGLHGDCTLAPPFRAALGGRLRFVELTYPRTVTWSLEDHARAVIAALTAQGIQSGWILAESFGSQIAWPLVEFARHAQTGFQVEGLILAGGFVRHPAMWTVRGTRHLLTSAPRPCLAMALRAYALYAGLRHGLAPETTAGLREFVARRTEADWQAIIHRLRLIEAADWRPLARNVRVPVFYLSGILDPVVPWSPVRRWLRRECPAWRGDRLLWLADHHVLGSAQPAVNQVLKWINETAA